MTVDVKSAHVDWRLCYENLWDRYIAISDALTAERERARALTTALVLLRGRLPQFTLDDFCDWQRDVIDAALAATEEGDA
jgi:hypothetical protein